MNDIFKSGMEKFLESAREELRQTGFEKKEIDAFSDFFRHVYQEELELREKFKGTEPIELEEFVDDVLRLTISRLEMDKGGVELKELAGQLWGFRAEQRLERLERKTEGESGKIVEFKRPH